MNIEQLLENYRAKASNGEETILYRLLDGGEVVGQEVNEDNELYYVIKRNNTYTVESAWNQKVVEILIKEKPVVTVIKLANT